MLSWILVLWATKVQTNPLCHVQSTGQACHPHHWTTPRVSCSSSFTAAAFHIPARDTQMLHSYYTTALISKLFCLEMESIGEGRKQQQKRNSYHWLRPEISYCLQRKKQLFTFDNTVTLTFCIYYLQEIHSHHNLQKTLLSTVALIKYTNLTQSGNQNAI